jgi:muramoyltetrapeptide carboxypeptidase
MAVRGGYGLTRLLGRIDWDLMRTAKKIWVGHSDFTAFHLALLAKTKASSLAGPMACYDFGSESISPFTERHFWRVLEGHEVSVKIKALRQPKLAVTGRLWGGNLTVLSSLVGTPYWPQLRGGILFLEDIHEHPYRIERMLYQLEQAGYLKQQRAVLLGDFSGYQLSAHDNGYDFERMVAHLRERFEVPIFTGLPFGHCPDKLTLPVGARASVVSERGGYRLIFSRH